MAKGTNENNYTNILKRISSFGGVQLFNVLINLIRGKLVALLLGPEGMGLSSLFLSSTNTIQQFSGLGLNLAFVKEVSASKEDPNKIPIIMATALRLIIITAFLGALVCLFLSPLLSFWSFGTFDYTLSFIALSISVALTVGGAGYLSLLQGLGEVKRLSKASIVGGLTGLLCGVPLYYFFGYNGIVPAIIILSLSTFLFYYFSFKASITFDKVKFIWDSHKPLVKKVVTLGLILMTGTLAGSLTNYLINIFIRTFGSVDNVGLFQAANSLTNQYVGIIFSALALDYFPRLSAISNDTDKLREVVNRQSEIVILIMTPLVIILFLTTPWIIKLLLADTFLSISPLMKWLGLGVLLQGVTFPLGYILLAKENRKLYLWMEIVLGNLLWLFCSAIFYYYFSMIGLGISLVVRCGIDILLYIFVCKKVYNFKYDFKSILIIAICLLMGTGGFLLSLLPENTGMLWLIVLLLISLIYSAYNLLIGIKTSH